MSDEPRKKFEKVLIEGFIAKIEQMNEIVESLEFIGRQVARRREAGIASEALIAMERNIASIMHGHLLGIQVNESDATLEDIAAACIALSAGLQGEESVEDKLVTAGIDPEWPEIVEEER